MTDLVYPKPTGAHEVGFADGQVIDDVYPGAEPGGRRIPVRVWYPAQAGSTGTPWRADLEAFRAYGNDAAVPVAWMEKLAAASASSIEGADPAQDGCPVLLFSHGANGFVDQNMTLMEELASHGYVAISLGHPGGACLVRHLDGSITGLDESFVASLSEVFPTLFAAFAQVPDARLAAAQTLFSHLPDGNPNDRWVDDFRAVLDALHGGKVAGPAGAIVDTCDLTRVAAGGFSFSGPAAVYLADQDPRLLAAISVDGGDERPELLDYEVRCPTLALSSDQREVMSLMTGVPIQLVDFHEFSYEKHVTIGTRADVHRIVFDNAAHHELTDVVLVPAEARAILPGAGRVDAGSVLPALNGLVRGFLDRYLQHAEGFPEEQLSTLAGIRRVDLSDIRAWANS